MGVRGGKIDWRKISSLLRSDIGYCFSASATRLDEILPLWKNTELLWAIFGMFNLVDGQRLGSYFGSFYATYWPNFNCFKMPKIEK